MDSVEMMKKKIGFLYRQHPEVHVNIALKHPRQRLTNLPVVIKAVYPHVFQLEDQSSGKPKVYMHQYNDLVTGEIEILELAAVRTKKPV